MHFATPLYFLIALVALPCLVLAAKRRRALGHSQIAVHEGIRPVPLLAAYRASAECSSGVGWI